MRLLHAGDPDHADRVPARQPQSHRTGGARRPLRQPVPLHRLPGHRQRYARCRQAIAGCRGSVGWASSPAPAPVGGKRRDREFAHHGRLEFRVVAHPTRKPIMKAAVVGENGVEIRDVPKPEPKPNEVLIRVRASSLNRADLLVATGHQHGALGGVGARLGLECAGEVEAVGKDVTGIKAGDRVMGSAPGGYAEYAVTDAGRVHRIPANNMTYEQAACFPVALQTMHNAVVTAGRLKRGETMLIQGASSGVGLMGMQIGQVMGAARVLGTSTNPARRTRLKEFGCDVAIDSSGPSWPAQVKAATDGKGVNLIVDQVSAGVANQNLEAAALLGRVVNVGRLGGMTGEFNFDLHVLQRIEYVGVQFSTRNIREGRYIHHMIRAGLWPALEAGKLSLPIDRILPLDRAAEALAAMKANQHFGKIVLTV